MLCDTIKSDASESLTRPDLRMKTPPQMKVELLEHQKLGVEWMLQCENGSNKGGLLADDMVCSLIVGLTT
jgi:SNF2 family DNA or RNA helicase